MLVGWVGKFGREKIGKENFQRTYEIHDNIIKFFGGNENPQRKCYEMRVKHSRLNTCWGFVYSSIKFSILQSFIKAIFLQPYYLWRNLGVQFFQKWKRLVNEKTQHTCDPNTGVSWAERCPSAKRTLLFTSFFLLPTILSYSSNKPHVLPRLVYWLHHHWEQMNISEALGVNWLANDKWSHLFRPWCITAEKNDQIQPLYTSSLKSLWTWIIWG